MQFKKIYLSFKNLLYLSLLPNLATNALLFLSGFLLCSFDEIRAYIIVFCLITLTLNLTSQCYSYFIRIAQFREIVSLKRELKIINNTTKVRIDQWVEFIDQLKDNHVICNVDIKKDIDLFQRRRAVSNIVFSLGRQFYRDLNEYCFGEESFVTVSYLQYEKDTDMITLKNKDNFFFSDNHPMKSLENDELKSYFSRLSFSKTDTSAASVAWNTLKPFFIPNVIEELNKQNPSFVICHKLEKIESILCIPIFHNDDFFGVVVFTSFVRNGIYSTDLIQKFVRSDLDPIFTQLTLIEYVYKSFKMMLPNIN